MVDSIDYYEYLNFVKEISKNLKSIQKNSVKTVYNNFHLCSIKKGLDLQIKKLDKLLEK